MLRSTLIHPPLLAALAAAGHGSQVLIADANFPVSTTLGPAATVVHLNLEPGTVDAVTVLRVLLTAVPVEEARVMRPNVDGPYALGTDPPIWTRFRSCLDDAEVGAPLEALPRFDFYEAARHLDTAVVVATGETEIYANLLLRIGVVR